MLTEKELAEALIVNIENWDWSINSKFEVDETTGKALVEHYKALKAQSEKTLHQMIDDVAKEICDDYCRYPQECKSQDELDSKCNDCPFGGESMNGLAKAFYVWQSPCKGDTKKPVEFIQTRDGRIMPRDEWQRIALEMIIQADLSDLLKQIEEYTQKHCLWVKMGDLREYSIDCLLKGSYKQWDEFIYQERLFEEYGRQ